MSDKDLGKPGSGLDSTMLKALGSGLDGPPTDLYPQFAASGGN